ncbi:MAG: 30S ribosomal protein S18 [Candidatus Omnitrophica bacterium]|nr:30S ribosomal protein S18 [Candidatus Omnitrophota bacterium]MDD5610098.1 30S ribosomal protein S18 [Candidatus Omnitrophota bacterium]
MIISKSRGTDKRGKKREFSKRPEGGFIFRKKVCRFCKDNTESLDYKDMKRLERFLTDRGKIFSSRLSGNCARHQRMLSEAIKRARFMSLLPYVKV